MNGERLLQAVDLLIRLGQLRSERVMTRSFEICGLVSTDYPERQSNAYVTKTALDLAVYSKALQSRV
jgi:hypothetical protein